MIFPPSIFDAQKPSSGTPLAVPIVSGGGFWVPGPIGSVPDSANQSTPALIKGGVTLVNGPFGGPALHFNGTNAYVDCGLNGATAFNWSTQVPFRRTFLAWFRLPSSGNGGPIFAKGSNSTNSGWSLSVSTTAITLGFIASANSHVVITTPISLAVWHQIAVAWNGAASGRINVYLDGALVGTGTSTSGAQNAADTFNLWVGQAQSTSGTGGATTQWFTGDIDHWFYDRRFYGPSEIADLYRRPFKNFRTPTIALGVPPPGVTALPAPAPFARPQIINPLAYEDDQQQLPAWNLVQRRRRAYYHARDSLGVTKFAQYAVMTSPNAPSISKFVQYAVLAPTFDFPDAIDVAKFVQYVVLEPGAPSTREQFFVMT